MILEYEIPKYDGDMGQPNVFVPLSLETCQRKIRYIMERLRVPAREALVSGKYFHGAHAATRDGM